MFEKKTKATIHKKIVIPFKIIAAKLIDHKHHNELGMSVIGRRERARNQAQQQQNCAQEAGEFHCELVYKRT